MVIFLSVMSVFTFVLLSVLFISKCAYRPFPVVIKKDLPLGQNRAPNVETQRLLSGYPTWNGDWIGHPFACQSFLQVTGDILRMRLRTRGHEVGQTFTHGPHNTKVRIVSLFFRSDGNLEPRLQANFRVRGRRSYSCAFLYILYRVIGRA
jgi:hypothetical protein